MEYIKFKMPVMVSFKWSPFMPAFTDWTSKDDSNTSDGQCMIATCLTGELPGSVFIHGLTPSVHHQYNPEQGLEI